ncbi:MAG: asparagine synthase (glutamine-hydrolyzing) [Eudoraea sp.]|nr:asparagine synthase (glutamine-hydrolyzing) [Eudoraea sp.]
MCGIFGVLNTNNETKVSYDKLLTCIQLQYHRGPDKQQAEIINPYVGLAHARLSIIDLSDHANQPLHYGSLSIVFNGEIFNYIELRNELKGFGYKFTTESDTEVILASFIQWGVDCVTRFNGMWAFAIYDKENGRLFCSRDRFGIKPFYYTLHQEDFLFSSEIKSILEYRPELRKPNYQAISAFCHESVGAENIETWFENILRLPPAHNLVLEKGQLSISRYWDYPVTAETDISDDEAFKTYKEIFLDAIRIRLRSDVPLGATMSGGLDSTSIVCSVDKIFDTRIDAYTASFGGGATDEYDVVKKLKEDGFDFISNKVEVQYDDFLKDLKDIIYLIESGHSSPAVFPLSKVNKRAREKLIVILEGQGADELLGGYIHAVFMDHFFDLIIKGQLKKALKELKEFRKQWSLKSSILMFGRYNLPFWARTLYRKWSKIDRVYSGELVKYSKKSFKVPKIKYSKNETRLNKLLKEQHQLGLLKLLHYGDAVSMMHSLESRLPFMDYRLVEYAFKLPSNFKIRNGLGKFIHRKIMEDILPDYITNDKRKIGFDTPIEKALAENNALRNILLNGTIYSRNLFKKEVVKQFLEETIAKKHNHSTLLFRILTVEIWFKLFIDQEQHEISKLKSSTDIRDNQIA